MATVNKTPDTPAEKDKPKTFMERFGAILAVALAALATVFAGMSAAALQRSMYWKAQAAQDQAKSTNQWTLAGFKRDRSLTMETSAAQLWAACDYTKPAEKDFKIPADKTSDPNFQKALTWLLNEKGKGGPPPAKLPDITDETINTLLKAIQDRKPETELEHLATEISRASTKQHPLDIIPSHVTINKAIDTAEDANVQIDNEWSPVIAAANVLTAAGESGKAQTVRQAALFELERRRYRAESRLNQGLGRLYDAKVIISSAESDKFYTRSTLLSYASMITQVGVVLASLALARKGSMLWILAAIIGIVAIGVGGHAMGLVALIMGTPH
jgi:hypothetical protein